MIMITPENHMIEDIAPLLAWGLAFMAGFMGILWVIHLKIRNAAIVDFGWAAGLGLLGVFYALIGDGYGPRRRLIGAMAFIWGGRLALHILRDRILGGKREDQRYAEIRKKWGGWITF